MNLAHVSVRDEMLKRPKEGLACTVEGSQVSLYYRVLFNSSKWSLIQTSLDLDQSKSEVSGSMHNSQRQSTSLPFKFDSVPSIEDQQRILLLQSRAPPRSTQDHRSLVQVASHPVKQQIAQIPLLNPHNDTFQGELNIPFSMTKRISLELTRHYFSLLARLLKLYKVFILTNQKRRQ